MSDTLSPAQRETLEMALSFGMNPETSQPLTPDERKQIEAALGTDAPEATPEAEISTGAGEQDLSAAVAQIQQQLAALTSGGQQPVAGQPLTLGDVLNQIDPRDSDAALAMFQWLVDNKRMNRIGMLDGGGYLLHYSEPKGTTKAGYTPGGTKGGRMVDQALEQTKAAGGKPADRGMCGKCYSVVIKQDDGTVTLDDDTASASCSSGGAHDFQKV